MRNDFGCVLAGDVRMPSMETNTMNRERKHRLFLLAFFSVAVSACTAAPTFTYADWADPGEVILERVELNGSTSVVIPDNVTAIGQYAFAGCDKMTSVVIPEGVQQIGEGAFFMCSGLTSVKVPDSVTSIGARAFEWCSSLATVTLGAGVSEIGPCAFHDGECSVKKFVVSGLNEEFKVSGGMLLTYDGTELVACPSATKGTVSVPDGVTTILPTAFYDCDSVSSVTFPSTLTEIQSNAFHDCGSIKSIALPASVENVGNEAFRKCKSLATVVVNGEEIEIGENAFSDSAALTAIVFAKAATVNEEAFAGTGSKCTIYVPDGSGGWPVEVPGRWNGVPVNYAYTPGTAVALETALKIQETCYVKMKGYPSSDFYHGPIAQVDRRSFVIILAPEGKAFKDAEAMAAQIAAKEAELLVFTNNEGLAAKYRSILLPKCDELAAPFVFAPAIQYFAQCLSLSKGLDPDNPRGLKKVTITK